MDVYLQVRATNNLCQMLPIEAQDECFSDWSGAVDVLVVDFEPPTGSTDVFSITETSSPTFGSSTDTTEATSSCT